jgi:hypothetical protein
MAGITYPLNASWYFTPSILSSKSELQLMRFADTTFSYNASPKTVGVPKLRKYVTTHHVLIAVPHVFKGSGDR